MGNINWPVVDVVLCLAAAALSLYLLLYAHARRSLEGAAWFEMLAAAAAWVAFWYALEAAAGSDLNTFLTFAKLETVGLASLPVAWLGFALTFSGKGRSLTGRYLGMIAIIPLVTVALAWTNEGHGLIWAQPRFAANSYPLDFAPVYGIGFWVYTVYAYSLFLLGSIALVRAALGNWKLYRTQSILILLATGLLWVSTVFEIIALKPVPGLYIHVIFLLLAVICLAVALFRLRLLDVMPLAYDLILNNMPEGVIVVDTQDHVLAVNRHARQYLDDPARDPVGQPLNHVLSKVLAHTGALRGIVNHRRGALGDKTLQFRISPVFDRNKRLRGRLIALSDITTRARSEQAEQEHHRFTEMLRQVANRLNSTLDSDRVLELILESVQCVVEHDRANVMLIEADGYTAHIVKHRGYAPADALPAEQRHYDIRQYATFSQAAGGETVIVADTWQYPDWKKSASQIDIRSYACAPIRVEGKLVGFINIDSCKPEVMTTEVGNRLQIFADQAALAIKNARLYEQMRRQTDELNRRVDSMTVVQRLYKEISFSFNINSVLDIALDEAMRLCRADAGYVAVVQEEDRALRITHCYGNYELDTLALIVDERTGLVGQSIAQQRSLMSLAPTPLVTALAGVKGQIFLPLFTADTEAPDALCGIMVLETYKAERFTDDRFQLLELLAGRVASALENARLVRAVQARAAELEELNNRLSRLEHLKSDMIRIGAHDLKNPLGVLMGYLDQILQEDPNRSLGQYSRIFNAMKRSAERMKNIIQDILSLERIERMAENQVLQPFDLRREVEAAVAEFAERAAEQQQQLELHLTDRDCTVSGDLPQLHEAITNFISNAIKYTPAGGCIRVALERENGTVSLKVTDTGYGIPDDQQSRLFEPFYRAKTKETIKIEGTGLGLHLVKNVIERHGGQLIFHSVYGQGSTFGFKLPVHQGVRLRAMAGD